MSDGWIRKKCTRVISLPHPRTFVCISRVAVQKSDCVSVFLASAPISAAVLSLQSSLLYVENALSSNGRAVIVESWGPALPTGVEAISICE